MCSWFKKYDSLTLRTPEFIFDIEKIKSDIPQLSNLEEITSQTSDEKARIWDESISLSSIEFENMLQKTLIKIVNLLICFFKSEYFIYENSTLKDFCKKSFDFLQIERRFFLNVWNKQNAMHSNFLMNRLIASFIRFLYFLQSLHKFVLQSNNSLVFIEAEPQSTQLNYENIYAIIDCLSAIFTSLLQRLSHLKNFLQNELNFLLRIYFFVCYFKTLSIPQNIQNCKQKFSDKDLDNMIYLIIDNTKTTVVMNKSLLSSDKVYEFEDEYEEDKTIKPTIIIEKNETNIEMTNEKSPLLLIENVDNPTKLLQRQKSYKNPLLLVKNKSYFFDDISESLEENKEDILENPKILLNSSKIRKSLIGDTRNSLIAEALATHHEDFFKKSSKFYEIAEKHEIEKESLSPRSEYKSEIVDNSQARSGIVRNLGENCNSYYKYMNLMNPASSTHHNPNDKESIMQSGFFAKSMNLPTNTILSTVHPSIIYYRGASSSTINDKKGENMPNSTENMNYNHANNNNIIKSMSNYKVSTMEFDKDYNYYDEQPKNEKYDAINDNLNDTLVKFLVDFGKKEVEKPEKKEEDLKNMKSAKKDNKNKNMNLYVKELENDSLLSTSMITRGDEGDTPKNSGRRTLSGKKELKKQLTLEKEKEEEQGGKHKRKSHKSGTKKLGITEKDLIKIDKNTEIKEKLIYSSFQEKLEEDVPLDEDILITTLSSETDEIKKKSMIVANNFFKNLKTKVNEEKTININTVKPHYRSSQGIMIPFFVRRNSNDEIGEENLQKLNKIAEEALNDVDVCEEHNDFFVASRKKDKKFEIHKNFQK